MGQALLGYCPPKDSEDLGTNENVSGGSSVCIYWDWDFFFFLAIPHGLWNLNSHIIMFFLTKNKNQCLCRYLNIFLLLLLPPKKPY